MGGDKFLYKDSIVWKEKSVEDKNPEELLYLKF